MAPPPYEEHRRYFAQNHTGAALVQLVQDYLRLARSFHYKYETIEADLRNFIRFLHALGITHPRQLNSDAALDYQQHLMGRSRPSGAENRLRAARRFCQHLLLLELIPVNPFRGIPSLRRPPFIPYIFTMEELSGIFQCLLRNPPRRPNSFARFTRYCAYHTIYACGLRISELSKLDLEHLDFQERTLTIRRSKFGKDRVAPFNDKVRRNLQMVLRLRHSTFPQADTPALFLNQKGTRLSRATLEATFRDVLRALHLYRKDRLADGVFYGLPTVHSLRHTFAVHRLLRWYRQGCDVNQKLPLLSTYMGHVHFYYTLVYLNVCSATLREANARFAQKFEDLFALWTTQTASGERRDER